MNSSDPEARGSSLPPWPSTVYHLTLAAIWVSAFFPEARLWGLNWYQYFGWPGMTVLLVVGLAAPWLIDSLLERRSRAQSESGRGRCDLIVSAATVIVFGLSFVLLSGRTHFLGDGYQVLGKVLAGSEVLKPWDSVVWTVQSGFFRLLGGAGEADALLALRVLSIGSGVLFLTCVTVASRKLVRSQSARIFMVLSLATGGHMLLFFGYVENYPPYVLLVALSGLVGLFVTRIGWSPWTVLIPTIPAVALHPFGVALIPAAIYLLVRRTSVGHYFGRRSMQQRGLMLSGVSGLLLIAIAYLWQTNLFFRFSLVPPLADAFTVEGYTMFSVQHLADYGNLLIMLFPGLLVAVGLLLRQSWRAILTRPEYVFLGLLISACLAIVFLFNPRLGMPRDWDLFAFAGVPLLLMAVTLVLDQWHDRTVQVSGWLMVVLGLLLLGPRVVSQAMPEKSIAVFDNFASLDVAKSRNGRFLLQEYLQKQGRQSEYERRAVVNALALPHERIAEEARHLGEQGYLTEAAAGFRRAIELDPSYHYAWANLGVVYRWLEQYDSALICLNIADGLNPYSFSTNMKLAGTYSGAGNEALAEIHWLEAARLMPPDLESRLYLLRLYQENDRWTEFDTLMSNVLQRDSVSLEILGPIVRRQLELDDTAAAAATGRWALDLGLDTTVILNLQEEFPHLQLIDFDHVDHLDSTSR